MDGHEGHDEGREEERDLVLDGTGSKSPRGCL